MPENENGNNGNSSWSLYQKLVLSEISRLDKLSQATNDKVDKNDGAIHKELADSVANLTLLITGLDKTIAVMRSKLIVYAGIAGFMVTAVVEAVVQYFFK